MGDRPGTRPAPTIPDRSLRRTWLVARGEKLTSGIVVGAPAKKQSRTPASTRAEKRPLSLWNFARFAALLTVGVTAAMILTAALQGGHEVWAVASILCLWTGLVVWILVLTIGCLVMVSVGIRRLARRLARPGTGRVTSGGRLWDPWIDGPEHSPRWNRPG